MRHQGLEITCMAALLLLCSAVAATGAQVTSITFCEDVSTPGLVPINIRETFPARSPLVNAVVRLSDAPAGTMVKGAWIAIDAITTPNFEIDSAEIASGKDNDAIHFNLEAPDTGWPPGNYRLEVHLDGTLSAIGTFAIVASGDTQGNAGNVPAERAASSDAQPRRQDPVSSLIGTWQGQGEASDLTLMFRSENQLVFDGEPAAYRIAGSTLQVETEYGVSSRLESPMVLGRGLFSLLPPGFPAVPQYFIRSIVDLQPLSEPDKRLSHIRLLG